MSLRKLKSFSGAITPTINLFILEKNLLQCQTFRQFNQILSQMIFTGYISDTYAASRLLLFSKNSSFVHVDYSLQIFNLLENPNGFVCNTMMKTSMRRGCPQDAISLYKLMLNEDIAPDNYTYPILVQATALRLSELEGRQMHGHVLILGFSSDVYVQNTLINMYAVCGNMRSAARLFDESPERDSVSWNSILAGYVKLRDLDNAKQIFCQMPKRNTIASNSMIDLYGKLGQVDDARKLFDEMDEKDMVSWTALLSCYEQNGMFEEALLVLKRMCEQGMRLDEVVVVSVISACAQQCLGETGKSIHAVAIKLGLDSYINLQNALISMYSKCDDIVSAENLFHANYSNLNSISWNSMISGYLRSGLFESARELFDTMPQRDTVSWTAMISGYAQHNRFSETLELFQEMQIAGETRPDEVIMVSVLSACTHLAALDQGKWIHAYIDKNNLKITNVRLGTTLIDMYMKCGCVDEALNVFHGMEESGVSTWNAAILGLAMNGFTERALELFLQMKTSEVVVPNEITFMGVLGACRHMGLVDEGQRHFDSMLMEFNIEPNIKHYGCMVDLLGRAGKLEEAEELIKKMPMSPDDSTWGALLGACRKHGNVEMGKRVGRKLIELHPDHDGFHILLSNMYASRGSWDNVIEIRDAMLQKAVKKVPGCSMIEANGAVHEFFAGDRTNPEMENKLEEIDTRLKMEGYMPDRSEVFLEIDEEEKDTSLSRHSEKLAVAFGLINIPSPMPIRIMKNLRICNDCHTSFTFVSKVYRREIVVRDRHRFHRFKDGSCSCKDFW